MKYIRWFEKSRSDDVPLVGGKNASLGEMIKALKKKGLRVPDGFAATAGGGSPARAPAWPPTR